MPEINFLNLAALTRDLDDAGSPNQLNITINVAGIDVAVAEFVADHPEAQGYLQRAEAVVSFDSESLTNSSVRIGNRGDNAWAPQHILLFAHGPPAARRPYRDGDGPDALAQFGCQRGRAHPAAPPGRAR